MEVASRRRRSGTALPAGNRDRRSKVTTSPIATRGRCLIEGLDDVAELGSLRHDHGVASGKLGLCPGEPQLRILGVEFGQLGVRDKKSS